MRHQSHSEAENAVSPATGHSILIEINHNALTGTLRLPCVSSLRLLWQHARGSIFVVSMELCFVCFFLCFCCFCLFFCVLLRIQTGGLCQPPGVIYKVATPAKTCEFVSTVQCVLHAYGKSRRCFFFIPALPPPATVQKFRSAQQKLSF